MDDHVSTMLTWDHGSTMLIEIRQKDKVKCCMVSLLPGMRKRKVDLIETEVKKRLPEATKRCKL